MSTTTDDTRGCLAFFTCHGALDNTRLDLCFDATSFKAENPAITDACLASFCFPVAAEMRKAKRYAVDAEHYCFATTNDKGERTHGFCRRIYWSSVPNRPKFPLVLCLLSNELWSVFHFKVLEVVEHCLKSEKLLKIPASEQLPPTSAAARFLMDVNTQLKEHFTPGARFKVSFPPSIGSHNIRPAQTIHTLHAHGDKLKCTEDFIEFQVPPLTGGSPEMAGVPLARLLWRIPVDCLLTLIASLLFERRIIMISTSKKTLSASIHAASALIYPFEWVSTYFLPLMPETLRDYLQAPFPFLVGLPEELSDFTGLEMDDVTILDLDRGTCSPEPGSPEDDAFHLPKRQQLQNDLLEAVKALRSPTEFEGNERIAYIMKKYMIRLFKNYRDFIRPKKAGQTLQVRERGCFWRGMSKGSPLKALTLTDEEDEFDPAGIDGHDYYFDHPRFVASHKSKGDKAFLEMLRQSQLYEVFIRQRLEMASLGGYPDDDPFEREINLIHKYTTERVSGQQPRRSWSRQLSKAHLSLKYGAAVEVPYLRSQTLAKHPEESTEADHEALLLQEKKSVQRRHSRSHMNSTSSRTIRSVVRDMAKASQKRLGGIEPGNFLKRSRASFVARGLDRVSPEEDAECLPVIISEESCIPIDDVDVQEDSVEKEEGETTPHSPSEPETGRLPTTAPFPEEQDLVGCLFDEDLADPLDPFPSLDCVISDDVAGDPEEEEREEERRQRRSYAVLAGRKNFIVGPEDSFRIDPSDLPQSQAPSYPTTMEEKAEALAESNLKALESTSSMRFGSLPKPQAHTAASQRFTRSDAFSLNPEK